MAVTRAGGAVGFLADEPESAIRKAAADAAENVRSGRHHLVAIDGGDDLVGVVFLEPGPPPRKHHTATVVVPVGL